MSGRRVMSIIGLVATAAIGATLLLGVAMRGRVGDPARLAEAERLHAEGMDLAARSEPDAAIRFRESADLLRSALATGDTADARFNRANALLRAGDLGTAIAEYRAAESRAPSDERIARNLAEARRKVANGPGVPAAGALERITASWALLSERARLFTAGAALFAAAILMQLGRRNLAAPAAGLGILLAATVALDLARRSTTAIAVIDEPTVLRKGNGDGFDAALAEALPVGTECRILESRPGWIEIEIAGPLTGWVKDTSLVRPE